MVMSSGECDFCLQVPIYRLRENISSDWCNFETIGTENAYLCEQYVHPTSTCLVYL